MKIKTFKVQVTKTKQIRQFEPLQVSTSIEAELEKGEDFDEAVTEARELCRNQVLEELSEWLT